MRFKNLLLILLLQLTVLQVTKAQQVRMQFINNCPDNVVKSIDIYVDGILSIDDLDFRTSTVFLTYNLTPPNNTITISLAPSSSMSIADTFLSVTTSVIPSDPNIVLINGTKNSAGYTPFKKVALNIFSMGRSSGGSPSTTDFLFANGATDLPSMDIKQGLNYFDNDLNYGSFSAAYKVTATANFKLRLTTPNGDRVINTYSSDFATNLLSNSACVIVASGFINPAANNNGPSFGLWLANATGGPLIPLSLTTPEAISRVQFINNSADSAADTVDIYIDGTLKHHNLALHNATAFEDYLSKTTVSIDIAPKNSASIGDAFYSLPITLDSARKYVFVANGIKSLKGYAPAPGYALSYPNAAMETAIQNTNTDMLLIQGSTDANLFDIKQGGTTLFSGASYGAFSSNYQTITTANYLFTVTMGTDKYDYDANLSTWGLTGKAVTLVASGFVKPATNAKGPEFGLWMATADGGPMLELTRNKTGIAKTSELNKLFTIWPNPAQGSLHLSTPSNAAIISADVLDITGKLVKGNVAVTNNDINIEGLNSGMYLLHFMYNNQNVNLRFVKQ